MRRALFLLLVVFASYIEMKANECGCCQTFSLGKMGEAITTTAMKFKWSQGEAETNNVDLLFVFDSSALEWLTESGWTEESFSDQILTDMNCGIALTGLDKCFSFRLAGRHNIETDLSEWPLQKLCGYASGVQKKSSLEQYFQPMRIYRDKIAADIVVVLTAPQDRKYYGMSVEFTPDYLTGSGMLTMAKFAYSVVDIRSAFDRYTVLHEVGHIFGAGHSDTQKSSPGPLLFPYSSGYNYSVNGQEFTTVMGYMNEDSNGNYTKTRLPFFSSPDFLHYGVPVGSVSNNDNTRTLRETYSLVANFKVKTYLPGYSEPESTSYGETGKWLIGDDISLIVQDGSGQFLNDGDEINLHQFEVAGLPVRAECWTGEKTTIRVTGLPTGMKYSSKTGEIGGYPKKTGTFVVKVTAKVKGKTERACMFTISVLSLPSAIVGSYAGIISNSADGDVLATANLYKTGRVVVKFNHEGRSRTFSCYGFVDADDSCWVAVPSAKINKVTQSLNAISDVAGRSISIEGYTGKLLQNPWGRKDIATPVFNKALQRDIGNFTVRLYGRGKAKLSASIDGKKVSGVFQLVAGTPKNGYQCEKWSLPAAFPRQRTFLGWAGWFTVDLKVDASNSVTNATVDVHKDL